MRWQRIETHVYIHIYIYVCVYWGYIYIYVYIYIVHTYIYICIYGEDIGLYRGTRKKHGKYHLGLSDLIPQYCWDQPERKGVL